MQCDTNDPLLYRLALRLPAPAAAAAADQATSTSSSSSTNADEVRVQEALTTAGQLASYWKGAAQVKLLQTSPGAIGSGGHASAVYSWQLLAEVRSTLDAGKPSAAQLVIELITKDCLLGVLTDLIAWLQQLPQLQQPLLHATAEPQRGSASASLEQLWDECMLCLASLLTVVGNRECQEDEAVCRHVQRIAHVLEDKGATYRPVHLKGKNALWLIPETRNPARARKACLTQLQPKRISRSLINTWPAWHALVLLVHQRAQRIYACINEPCHITAVLLSGLVALLFAQYTVIFLTTASAIAVT
jgi:hypothetical protein